MVSYACYIISLCHLLYCDIIERSLYQASINQSIQAEQVLLCPTCFVGIKFYTLIIWRFS